MSPEDAGRHEAAILVPPDHPAIPGHFPGNPVVPAVLILHEIILAGSRWLGNETGIRRLRHAKFIAPLQPGEQAAIELDRSGDTLAFSVRRGPVLVAKGAFGLEPPSAS